DGLPVGCTRRKLKSCEGQILPLGRPSFNFQQLLGRFLIKQPDFSQHFTVIMSSGPVVGQVRRELQLIQFPQG
ncbi:MAG: hypothetical protein ABGZ53_25830, partial [Fuerstiella sp.]